MNQYLVTWSYSLDVDFVIEVKDEDEAAEIVENLDMGEVSDLGIGEPGGGLYFEIAEIDDDTDIHKLRREAREEFDLPF
jgi:hypothetical protein